MSATPNPHAGRHGTRWRKLRANIRAQHRPCCRCGKAIDYTLTYPHPKSFSIDHFPYPLSTHPWLAEDPGNLAAAHLRCNQKAGGQMTRPRRPPPDLGITSNW